MATGKITTAAPYYMLDEAESFDGDILGYIRNSLVWFPLYLPKYLLSDQTLSSPFYLQPNSSDPYIQSLNEMTMCSDSGSVYLGYIDPEATVEKINPRLVIVKSSFTIPSGYTSSTVANRICNIRAWFNCWVVQTS